MHPEEENRLQEVFTQLSDKQNNSGLYGFVLPVHPFSRGGKAGTLFVEDVCEAFFCVVKPP